MNTKKQSRWELVDAADSVMDTLMLGVAVLMLMYGVLEGTQAIWPLVA